MTRHILGAIARAEIRDSIRQCRNSSEIAAEADRLAAHYGVGRDRIYTLTKDLRPRRKMRCDRGNRRFNIATDETLQLVAGWVLEYDVTPAEAINLARQRGLKVEIEFPTLQRYLREQGLDKKSRRNPVSPHRRFEASAPGEMFQFDISGVKERWYDSKTRRIVSVSSLEVSKNHDNERPDRVRVWRFALIDDFSRRCFIRYVGVAKPNSSHVVDFLLSAYAEMGVPLKLYTDNDKIIKFGRNARTTEILNKVLIDQGGYENIFHLPGLSRATGKVERLHQTVEQCEKFIGQYIAERGVLSIEDLNSRFAAGVMAKLNSEIHSETGWAPMERWQRTFSRVRTLDPDQLRSAFMADEHLLKLRGDLTFRFKGETFQLPAGDQYPFADWVGQKLRVVFPDNESFFTLIGLDGNEYDIVKKAQAPDVAGDFRSTRQTNADKLRKHVKAVAREDAKRIRERGKIGIAAEPIRFFDQDPAAGQVSANVAEFPKPEIPIDVARVEHEAPGRISTPVSHDPALNFWEAVSRFEKAFGSKAICKEFMDSLFPGRGEEHWLLLSELTAAVDQRGVVSAARRLKAV